MDLMHEHVVAAAGSSASISFWIGMNDVISVSFFLCCCMRYEYSIWSFTTAFKSVVSVLSNTPSPRCSCILGID